MSAYEECAASICDASCRCHYRAPEPCCDDGPVGHTQQQHHDASPCYEQACELDHPNGGPFPHPCDDRRLA